MGDKCFSRYRCAYTNQTGYVSRSCSDRLAWLGCPVRCRSDGLDNVVYKVKDSSGEMRRPQVEKTTTVWSIIREAAEVKKFDLRVV